AFAESGFNDWKTGDLIFQESLSAQANAIRVVTGSRYTQMGVVRQTATGPVVVAAARTVSETPLKEFIGRGVEGQYAVYRVKGLTQEQLSAAVNAALKYRGRPYDIFFRLEPSAIYCSELPFYAFKTVGVELGKVE